MDIINLIQQKYGNTCQLCAPLSKEQRDEAKNMLSDELLKVLTVSNGINEVMTHPNTNDGNPFVFGTAYVQVRTCSIKIQGFEKFQLHFQMGNQLILSATMDGIIVKI